MVNLYVKRIVRGLMTINDVPKHWREDVRKALEKFEKEYE